MSTEPTARRSGSEGAWIAAVIVIAISLLSTFTLSKPGATTDIAARSGSGSFGPSGSNRLGLPTRGRGGSSAKGGSRGIKQSTSGIDQSSSGIDQSSSSGGADQSSSGIDQSSSGGADQSNGGIDQSSGGGGGDQSGGGQSGGGGGSQRGGGGGGGGGASNADCSKGQNAGATDVGITPNAINMAATVVRTGIAKDFLFDAQYGMAAVEQKINKAGGICGRLLNIHEEDDGWDPQTGDSIIQKYIGCNCYFGLAVNPSSEGIRLAIDSGLLDQNHFLAVGTDGMLIDQYQDPWVWPVATSTHSSMHVIADEAYKAGARNVGIVWESNFRFGVEGESAFVGEAKRLGMNVVTDAKITSGQTSYSNDASNFVGACTDKAQFDKCDFVAVLLEPATADQWVRNGGLGDGSHHPKYGLGAPQPLFINSFANDCGAPCNGLEVWTGFKPPIPPFDSDPAVGTYKSDVQAVSSSADTNNPEVEGAYQGMELLAQALTQLGAAPTRADLQSVLDSTTLDTGLGPSGQFASGNHFAFTAVQGFDAVYNGNSFVGWRYSQSGFISDNEVAQDIPSS